MLYERKIKYLDYVEKGQRIQGGGYVKMEARDGKLRVELAVTGLRAIDSCEQDVLFKGRDGERPVGKITILNGRGQYRKLYHNLNDIAGSGISYEELQGIRIMLGAGREVSCSWAAREKRRRETGGGQKKSASSGGTEGFGSRKNSPASSEGVEGFGSRKSSLASSEGVESSGSRKSSPASYEGAEGSGSRKSSQTSYEGAEGSGSRRSSPAFSEGAEGSGSRKSSPASYEGAEGSGSRKSSPISAAVGDTDRNGGGYTMETAGNVIGTAGNTVGTAGNVIGTAGNTVGTAGNVIGTAEIVKEQKHNLHFQTTREDEEQVIGTGPDLSGFREEKSAGGHAVGTGTFFPGYQEMEEERGKVLSMASLDGSDRGQELYLDRREDRMENRKGNWMEEKKGSRAEDRRNGGKQKGKAVRLLEDKWDQLWAIYPHIRPFQDGREYLSIEPSDFVLFPGASYRAVNNSFLLHGYYNYHHLILTRMERKGEVLYYIGVPGNFFEREKQVAIMFGFESFECAEEPAQAGDFGYYMMRTQL